MTRPATPTGVTIAPAGRLARVAPAPELLGHFRVGRVEPGGAGTGSARRDVPLFAPAHDPAAAVVWGGLASAAAGMPKRNGVGVETPAPADPPAWAAGADVAAGPDPAVAAFAGAARRGLVRYGPGVDPLTLIAWVVVSYPRAAVVVLVRRRRDAGRLVGLLRALGVRAGIATGRHRSSSPRRVTVATLGATGWAGIVGAGVGRADLVLVADALHATWADPLTEGPAPPTTPSGAPPAVGLMDRLKDVPGSAAVLGFLPTGRPLSPFERARAWQLYGQAELTVLAPGAIARPVVVAAVPVALAAAPRAATPTPAVRARVALDPVRCRRLARAARLLHAGDSRTLAAAFPAVAAAAGDNPGGASVLVLADGADQALAFGRHLPGAVVMTGVGVTGGTTSCPIDRPLVVGTPLGLEKLAEVGFDAVVRADPGRGLPPLPAAALIDTRFPARPLLLVDADDGGHPAPAAWSRDRRRAYLRAGWPRAVRDPDLAAWDRFRLLVLEQGRGS